MLDGSPHEEYSSKKLLPKSLNLLDYRVEELAIAYGLKYVHNFGEGITAVNAAAIGSVSFKKVILSSSSSCVDEIDDGFVIMAIKEGHSKLLVWRKEDGRRHIQFEDKSFADIAYHNERFYALSVDGLILSVDSKTLDVTELAKYPYISYFGSYVCLVKSFKEFFLKSLNAYIRAMSDMIFRKKELNTIWLRLILRRMLKRIRLMKMRRRTMIRYLIRFCFVAMIVHSLSQLRSFRDAKRIAFFFSFNDDRIFKMEDYDGGDISQFPKLC